ncbi:MAG TPA: helix-turn-helix domain-containing protein [Solirubrobacteraceae bacterium]|nr:helix-turn-helix domain-containing protein [Solirubrobacteraceae bacterium]
MAVEEIAEACKVSKQTVRTWIDRRQLKSVRLGTPRVRVKAATSRLSWTPACPKLRPREPTKEEVEAWTGFGLAMARPSAKLKQKRSRGISYRCCTVSPTRPPSLYRLMKAQTRPTAPEAPDRP